MNNKLLLCFLVQLATTILLVVIYYRMNMAHLHTMGLLAQANNAKESAHSDLAQTIIEPYRQGTALLAWLLIFSTAALVYFAYQCLQVYRLKEPRTK